jgi:hypothetical protein
MSQYNYLTSVKVMIAFKPHSEAISPSAQRVNWPYFYYLKLFPECEQLYTPSPF